MFRSLYDKKERGQGLVEYALVLVLVAVVVIGILTALGPKISEVYAEVVAALSGDPNAQANALYAKVCSNRSWPSGKTDTWTFDVVVYKGDDGWLYTAKVDGVWAGYPTDPATVAGVTAIYGYIPANTTVTCP